MNVSPTHRRTVLRGLALATAGTVLPTVAAATAHAAPAPAPGTAAARSGAEPDTYALTLVHLDRAGAPTGAYTVRLAALEGPDAGVLRKPHDPSGTVTLRLPRGRYLFDSSIAAYDAAGAEIIGTDWMVRPRLDLDRDMTVVVDARTARQIDVRPPDPTAQMQIGGVFVEVTYGGRRTTANLVHTNPNTRMAHLGPAAEPGSVRSWVDAYWKGDRTTYVIADVLTSDRTWTGIVRRPEPAELGTLVVRAVAPPGGPGYGLVDCTPQVGATPGFGQAMRVPGATTIMVSPERGDWDVTYTAPMEDPESEEPKEPNRYFVRGITVPAGRTVVHTFDAPVFGPALDPSPDARPPGVRTGDTLELALPLLADGDGHLPTAPPHRSARTTLHRDGKLLASHDGDPGLATFTVPPGRAAYRLTATAARPVGTVTACWSFLSATTRSPVELPLSVVRFTPPLAPDGTAAPGRTHYVPVAVRGAAARSGSGTGTGPGMGMGPGVRSLTVRVSTDGGVRWSVAPVVGGRFAVAAPGPGGTVSLRAELVDSSGNTLTQTHIDAYGTSPATL
ncbi:serine protease [Streptomyces sp. NPDC090025]|uniref:serine protease n=1 Tax=Streptomyces sp. NPDC090025 TaxID=3365922 RepID=UPI003834D5AD